MSIKEAELYHGSVFTRLAQSGTAISIRKLDDDGQGFYVLNEAIPMFIKHTTKKISPWRFSFNKPNQDSLQDVKVKYGSALVVFVCGHDGICCLEFDEFKNVLDYVHEEIEWVSVKRRKHEKYSVAGKDGELRGKVAEGDFIKKICKYLNIKLDENI